MTRPGVGPPGAASLGSGSALRPLWPPAPARSARWKRTAGPRPPTTRDRFDSPWPSGVSSPGAGFGSAAAPVCALPGHPGACRADREAGLGAAVRARPWQSRSRAPPPRPAAPWCGTRARVCVPDQQVRRVIGSRPPTLKCFVYCVCVCGFVFVLDINLTLPLLIKLI